MRTFAIFILLTAHAVGYAQSGSSGCGQASRLITLFQQKHIQPLPLGDEWSQRVFQNFFYELDPLRLYLTQEDIESFSAQQTQLDDLIKDQKHCAWISSVSQVLNKKADTYKQWIDQALSKPFDYTVAEELDLIHFPPEEFSASGSALDAHRIRYFKFQMLMRMYMESVSDSSDKPVLTYEAHARKKLKAKELQKAVNLESKGFEAYAGKCFLRAIAKAYDPHSAFLSGREKDSHNTSLSAENISFGFSLKEDQTGGFIVKDIVPGGPAWNSGKIHEGDYLLSVEPSAQPVLNTIDYELDDLIEVIESSAVHESSFTFRRPDGRIAKIKLVKEKVRSLENTVSGYVLNGTKKIGYISLPSFYYDRTTNASGGCANDVAKALIKLSHEKIEGLILDLRFNGGGSMNEARELAGIFIDYGPIILYQATGEPVVIFKDTNKGTIYNGPLIVMVNGYSASASELLAASLQDHKRALIVGTQTYGKATGQNFEPVPGEGLDFVKVTSLKIYRVNGKSYQHKGITPDVSIPDLSQSFSDREERSHFSLKSDSVTKKVYYTPASLPALEPLVEKSKIRISVSPEFKEMEQVRTTLQKPIPLNITGFVNYMHKPQKLTNAANTLNVTNPSFDAALYAVHAFRKVLNEKSVQEIRQSIYIREAYNIMLDYIDLKK